MAWLVSDEQPSLFKQRTRGEILYILLQKRSFFFLLFFFRFRFFKIRGYLKKCNSKTIIGETCFNDKKSLIEIKNVSTLVTGNNLHLILKLNSRNKRSKKHNRGSYDRNLNVQLSLHCSTSIYPLLHVRVERLYI